jgi:hypothetical protein
MKKLLTLILLSILLSVSLTAFAKQNSFVLVSDGYYVANGQKPDIMGICADTTELPKPDTATQNLINIEQSAVFQNVMQYVNQNFQNLTIKEANAFGEWFLKLLTNSASYYFQELEKKKPPKR